MYIVYFDKKIFLFFYFNFIKMYSRFLFEPSDLNYDTTVWENFAKTCRYERRSGIRAG